MLDLDIWTADLVSKGLGGGPDLANITLRQAIDKYTEKKLKETVEYARSESRYYKEILPEPSEEVSDFLEWFRTIPFTFEKDLREREKDLLCVSPSQISRIVTMNTSGTTGDPKRIYFTEEDQQLTIDYFHHGMKLIVDETDTVLILMPSKVPGSIGLLLKQGLEDLGAKAIDYGLPNLSEIDEQTGRSKETAEILDIIKNEGVTSIVAMPTHMIKIARQAGDDIQLRSILLSAEFVPDKTVMMLEEAFECMVFEHYGMTEMGLGCAVSCGYGRGYHVREADLYLELINPQTGEVIDGENPKTPGFSPYGEIVFTTLTRKGMPFIRYRTGDFSRWILEDCPCGSCLKRLDKVMPGR